MCRNCYARMERDNAIQDYYYKPTPQFFGAGPRFFGVELEVDKAGESDRNAWELLSIANGEGEKRLYCKHDGSLNDGFELVSPPHVLVLSQGGNAVGENSAPGGRKWDTPAIKRVHADSISM